MQFCQYQYLDISPGYSDMRFTHLCAGGFSFIGALRLESHFSELHACCCYLVYVRSFGLTKAKDVEGSLKQETATCYTGRARLNCCGGL